MDEINTDLTAAPEVPEISERLRVAERERDSLTRRLSVRYEELERLRAEVESLTDQLGDMRAMVSAAEADRYQGYRAGREDAARDADFWFRVAVNTATRAGTLCPRCHDRFTVHWPDDERGKPGCHAAGCLCSYSPEEILCHVADQVRQFERRAGREDAARDIEVALEACEDEASDTYARRKSQGLDDQAREWAIRARTWKAARRQADEAARANDRRRAGEVV